MTFGLQVAIKILHFGGLLVRAVCAGRSNDKIGHSVHERSHGRSGSCRLTHVAHPRTADPVLLHMSTDRDMKRTSVRVSVRKVKRIKKLHST